GLPENRLKSAGKSPIVSSRRHAIVPAARASRSHRTEPPPRDRRRSMPKKVRIALDAMGGDRGAAVVVPGAGLALSRHPDSAFIFFGDAAVVEPLLRQHLALVAVSRVVHTDVAVKMDEKPSQALRHGRWKSSMWLGAAGGEEGGEGGGGA